MNIKSPKQLKDLIKNYGTKNNVSANILLQNFMMERLLERISLSKYKDNFILKGGFLIASMIGVNLRSTLDMDTTIKGIPINEEELINILSYLFSLDLQDNTTFNLIKIKNIHDVSEYDDFRVTVEAKFFTIRVNMKIDITVGDIIIPKEIDYQYKLMLEDKNIEIKSYNLYTILAEKIESIISRNVSNTRARDFYDTYMLLSLRKNEIVKTELWNAILKKSEERGTKELIEKNETYLEIISESIDLLEIWDMYRSKYPYAKDIEFKMIMEKIEESLDGIT